MTHTVAEACWHLDAASSLAGLIEQLAHPIAPDPAPGRSITAPTAAERHRIAVSGPDMPSLQALRESARQQLMANARVAPHDDMFYTDAPLGQQGVALMFPGQGSQHPGMLAEWLKVPEFSSSLQALDEVARPVHGRSLKAWFFDEPGKPEHSLAGTLAAQTALGFGCSALARTLTRLGVQAGWAVGHSYGELVALWHAGAYDDHTLMQLTLERGQAMAQAAVSLPGGLIAVGADGAAVASVLKDWPDLELANLNAPTQTVVGGPRALLEDFATACQQRGWRCVVIQGAAAAFHTSRMQPAMSAWQAHLQRCARQKVLHATTRARVIANLTASPYPTHEAGAADFIAHSLHQQVTSRVRWVETCRALHDAGVRLFIEVGPGQVLSKLIQQNLVERPHRVIACSPKGDASVWLRIARLQALLAIHDAWLPTHRPEPSSDTPPPRLAMKPDTQLIEAFLQENTRIVERYFALMERVLDSSPSEGLGESALQQMLSDSTRLTEAHLQVHERLLGTHPAPPAMNPSACATPVTEATPAEPSSPSTTNQNSDLLAWLQREVSQLTGFPASAIDPQARFDDLGVDSLAFMDICAHLNQRVAVSAAAADRVLAARCIAEVIEALVEPTTDSASPQAPMPEIGLWLRKRVAEATGFSAEEIDVHAALEDLGIDSLARTDLFEALGAAWPQARQHASALFEARSILDIVDLLAQGAATVATPGARPAPRQVVVSEPPPVRELSAELQDLKAELLTSLGPSARLAGVPLDETTPFQALALNSFDRARLWGQAARWQPPFKIAGEALISVSSVKEGLELLANLPSTGGARKRDASVRSGDRLQRYRHIDVPRHVPEAPAIDRLLLIGPENARVARLAAALTGAGTQVARLTVSAQGWTLPGAPLIALSDVDALRQALSDLTAAHPPCCATFITPGPGVGIGDTDNLEAPSLALFTLAKALGEPGKPGRPIRQLSVVLAGEPMADAGARGVARALSHEWRHAGIAVSSVALDESSELLSAIALASAHPGKHDLWLNHGKAGERIADPHPDIDAPATARLDLDENSVVLLFGGGVGIAAEVGIDLARRYRARIVAIGRTEWDEGCPHPEITDDDTLSEAIYADLVRQGGSKAPDSRELQAALNQARRQRALARTAQRVREAGGQFHYLSADLTQAEAVHDLIDQIAQSRGRIDMVIHAAGVVEDRGLNAKSIDSFLRVFRTKARSAWHLRSALARMNPKYVVFFSSLVSHTGNAGQADYCAGNEVLNAMAHDIAAASPDSRVASMLWSVWHETGLANRAVQQRMAQMGMTGIGNADGTRRFHTELSSPTVPDWLLISCPRMLEVMQGNASAA